MAANREIAQAQKDTDALQHRKLEEIPTQDLLAEIKRREEEKRNARIAKQTEHVRVLREHADALLEVFSTHSRTSCSDSNHANSHRQCVRCALFELREYGDFPFTLSATLDNFDPDREF